MLDKSIIEISILKHLIPLIIFFFFYSEINSILGQLSIEFRIRNLDSKRFQIMGGRRPKKLP